MRAEAGAEAHQLQHSGDRVNLNAKIKKLEREIEALWLACGGRPPVAPAAPPEPEPKRRGRPPKVTNGN